MSLHVINRVSCEGPSSIYGLIKLRHLGCEVFLRLSSHSLDCLSYTINPDGTITWNNEPVRPVDLRLDSQCLSFAATQTSNGPVVALSVLKRARAHMSQTATTTETFLLSFYKGKTGEEPLASVMSSCCTTLELDYVPYCIRAIPGGNAFLVGGSDGVLHQYQFSDGLFVPVASAAMLRSPTLKSIVISMHLTESVGYAWACDQGSVYVQTSESAPLLHTQVDGPVPLVYLMYSAQQSTTSLLLGGAAGYALVYQDIANNGLSACISLEGCANSDGVYSATELDLNWDGQSDLLIGTYSGDLIGYHSQTFQMLFSLTLDEPIYNISLVNHADPVLSFIVVNKTLSIDILSFHEAQLRQVVLEQLNH